MKRCFLLTCLVFQLHLVAQSQNLLGIANSNYAGTHGLYMNPANTADNRYAFYLNFFSAQANLTNNRFYFDFPKFSEIEDFEFSKDDLKDFKDRKNYQAHGGIQFRALNFMVRIDHKSGFAFLSRLRGIATGNNTSKNITDLVRAESLDDPILLSQSFNKSNFNLQTNAYLEYALNYGRTVWEKDNHFLKVGITVKRLVGIYSGYIVNQEMDFDIIDNPDPALDEIRFNTIQAKAGYSNDDFSSTIDEVSDIFSGKQGGGWGADLGAVYEFRPEADSYRYTMDGEERIDNRANKYKYRIGLSLTDLGWVKYANSKTRAYDLNVKNRTLDEDDLSDGDDIEDIIDELDPTAEFTTKVRSGLPTALNLNFDYQLAKRLYINATYIQSLKGKNTISARTQTMLAITPRFESHGIEFAIPLSLQNGMTTFAYGAALKLGPLFIGSDNIEALFGSNKTNGTDIYVGLNLPIRPRKRASDKDLDGISDKQDECKDTPGILEFKGCPDKDGDKIQDKDDDCPEDAGLAEFKGCPDKDGDKVPDKDDDCPNEAGLVEFQGCPDKDGDKIPDKEDDCPDAAGLVGFKGCPDTDGDNIMDKNDACPEVAGLAEFQGCPDTDGDRIPDKDDKCPDKFGSAQFAGCPDTDLDGIPDNEDACPAVFGVKANNGCPEVKNADPVLTQEEKEILKEVFEDLEFETGKAVIAQKSKESLKELAVVLLKKPQYRLRISGHTDNVGVAQSNLTLSKQRAEAVKAFLKKEGVSDKRLIAEGFGQTKPIADNKTAEGRQKNRRVEFKIIK